MSHGDAQKFITTGELPKEIAVLVKTGEVEKPKASPKPKVQEKTAEQLEIEKLRKEIQDLLAKQEYKKPTAKEAAAAIAKMRK